MITGHEAPIRRGKIRMTTSDLRFLLVLPDDLRIIGVQSDNDPLTVDVIVEGASLDAIPPDSEAPYLVSRWAKDSIFGAR